MARIVGLIIALALAGCGKASDQHHVVATDTDLAAPGQYRERLETRIELPGVPPRVEERVKTHCLKGGEEPVRREITGKFAELCQGSGLRFADGEISGELTCRHSSGTSERGPVRVSGSYDRDRVELITDSQYQGASVRQVRHLERIGDCDTVGDAIARGDWSIAENHEAGAH